MSAKKEFSTKLLEDENTDSGFLTGEISGPCEDSKEIDPGFVEGDDNNFSGDISKLSSEIKRIEVSPPCPDKLVDLLFQQDEDGDTQLHIASVHGCEKSVKTLIKICPDKSLLDVTNDYRHTPLHLAVMSRNSIVTRMLVIAGASLAVRDYLGETPLHKATVIGDLDCLKALLMPVIEYKNRKLSTVLDQKNYNGKSCIHLAASAGNIQVLQLLVYYGADVNVQESLAGWTALHLSARAGEADVVSWLRSRGAVRSLPDYAGRTPRALARNTRAKHAFGPLRDDSDTDMDTDDDDMYDSDSENLFEKIKDSLNISINVA